MMIQDNGAICKLLSSAYTMACEMEQCCSDLCRTNSDSGLEAGVAGIVLEELDEHVSAQALAASEPLFRLVLAGQPPLRQVGRLPLRGALEGNGGRLLSQVLQPRLCHLPRHQVCMCMVVLTYCTPAECARSKASVPLPSATHV